MDRLLRLAEADDGSDEALRDLLSSLLQLSASAADSRGTVDNHISGGVQHGPVVQSGSVAGLTFHVDHVDRADHQ
ncbi:hypothetical protein ACUJ8N_30840 [Streptomyces sp. ESR1.13]|uniref:hypothetical protein n=1 Tax=unclassified Streptomyces TaxID=2593676 RepID=UPI00404192C0